MNTPTRRHLEDAAREFFDDLTRDIDQPRGFPKEGLREAVAYNVHLSEERITELDRQLISNDFDGEADQLASDMLSGIRTALADLDPTTGLLARQLAVRATREQMRYLIHALTTPASRFVAEDEVFALAADAPFSEGRLRTSPTSPSSKSRAVTLADATAEYLDAKERSNLGASQIEETARLLEWLKQVLGDNRLMGEIQKAELRTFRHDLTRMDANLKGRAALFMERLTDDPKRWPVSATYNRYWNATRGFFAWAMSEGLADHDPTFGLLPERKRGEVKRTPEAFSQEEVLQLFRTPLYRGAQSHKRLKQPGSYIARGGHWWSAVLMAHTGMRAGELSQLLPSDFDFVANVPHVLIQTVDENGADVKSVKNEASKRAVPLHSDLMTLGLRQFVEGRAKRFPKDRVFREYRLGGPGKYTDGITRFWRDYLAEFDLKTPGRATHVWRHTFVARLRAVGCPEEDIQAIIGHTRQTTTSDYGGKYPLPERPTSWGGSTTGSTWWRR